MKILLVLTTLTFAGFAGVTRAEDPAPVKPDALDYCVISGDKLGEMGKPVSKVFEGQEIKFCCKECVKDFEKDPAAGLKKYDEAVAKAAAAK